MVFDSSSLFGAAGSQGRPAGSIIKSGNTLIMEPGVRVNLELLGSGERIWGEVVGCKKGEFICISFPKIKQYKRKFITENRLAVRAVSEGCHLCGFRTTIAHTTEAPYPLIFLDYPNEYERVNLRKGTRVDCFVPTTLYLDGDEFSAIMVNLSSGGGKVVIDLEKYPEPPAFKEEMEIFSRFMLPDEGDVYCRTLVRKILGNKRQAALGIRFEDVIGAGRESIDNFVSELKKFTVVQ